MDNVLREVSMGRPRRSFTKEFKGGSCSYATEGGCRVAQVARDLGIRDTMLGGGSRSWPRALSSRFQAKGRENPKKRKCAACDAKMSGCVWNWTS